MTAHSPIRQTADARPQDFAHVTEWVFDLDNTLYPRHTNLFSQIDQRMTAFVSDFLTLPKDEARVVQKDFYRRYGTTLRGLMQEHDVDPDAFLQYVHDIDYSWLAPDTALGDEIPAMPNAPRASSAFSTISRTSSTSSRPGWCPSPPLRPTTSSSACTGSMRSAP